MALLAASELPILPFLHTTGCNCIISFTFVHGLVVQIRHLPDSCYQEVWSCSHPCLSDMIINTVLPDGMSIWSLKKHVKKAKSVKDNHFFLFFLFYCLGLVRSWTSEDWWDCPCAQQPDTKLALLSHKQHIQVPELSCSTLYTKVELKKKKSALNSH